MSEKDFEILYGKLKTACLSNVLNRVTEECIDDDKDEVDIVKLKKELNSFRHREIDEPGTKKKTEGNLTYYLLVRKLESFAAEHLRKYVATVDEDVISTSEFSKAVKSIDIDTPLPNMAPDLPTKVVIMKEKDNTTKKDGIQLTTEDSIKKRYQSTLVLRTAKDGTLYEARSRICYKRTTDNHYVAIGKFDTEFKKHKLTKEDIEQITADGYPYINEQGDEVGREEDIGGKKHKQKKDKEEEEEDNEEKINKKDKEDDNEEEKEDEPKKKEKKKEHKKKKVAKTDTKKKAKKKNKKDEEEDE